MEVDVKTWAVLLALALISGPALAQQSRTVGGLSINLGLMPAEQAMRAEGHRDAHPEKNPPGTQHILVTLDDAKTGKRIGNAEVVVELTDPKGHADKKPLLHTQAAGLPDYSEMFQFNWSGKYSVRVSITPKPGAKPVVARFTVNHAI
jgi:hypothetical protein